MEIKLECLESYDQIREGDLIYGARPSPATPLHCLAEVLPPGGDDEGLGYKIITHDEPLLFSFRQEPRSEEVLRNTLLLRREEGRLILLAGEDVYRVLSGKEEMPKSLTRDEELEISRVYRQGTSDAIEP